MADRRVAGQNPLPWAPIVPFRRSGWLALFEIEDNSSVAVLALCHQFEDDDHY